MPLVGLEPLASSLEKQSFSAERGTVTDTTAPNKQCLASTKFVTILKGMADEADR
jgi:hypothetical protein